LSVGILHLAIVAAPSTINLTELVGEGATGMAFRGQWHGAAIVAKHAMPKESQALVRESLFYKEHLAHLRGVIIPEFLGLYRSDGWAMMVLEERWFNYSWEFRNIFRRGTPLTASRARTVR
jgi:hypothetical protein